MNREIKRKAKHFIKKYHIRKVSYVSLREIAEQLGYILIEFNRVYNQEDVGVLIQNLDLGNIISSSRGFTYTNQECRLIFIHEDLNENEKMLVLLHELGHIICGHLAAQSIIGQDVKEEYEANEFVHYILHPGFGQTANNILWYHKRAIIVAMLIIISVSFVIGTGAVIRKENTYYGEYYITTTGDK